MRIRAQARLVWRIVSEDDKEDWQDLHLARYSDPNVYEKGRRLLEAQGLLAILRPKCEHIVNTADAGPSRPAPARLEPAEVSAAASNNDTSNRSHVLPQPALLEHISVTHPRSIDTASTSSQHASHRSNSPPEPALSEHTSSHPIAPVDAFGTRAAMDQSHSHPASAPSQHKPIPVASKDTVKTKSKLHKHSSLPFRADHSEEFKLSALFPHMKPATWSTPADRACYVSFAPRQGKVSRCLFIVNTPDKRTGRPIVERDVQLACSASGFTPAKRCNDNVFSVRSPNREGAENAQITLPSALGGLVVAKASLHRTGPPRTFSFDATLLNVEPSTVAERVLGALSGSAAGPTTYFDLLRQECDQHTRYLIRFEYGLEPPCTPWLQCFYIPMDDKRGNGLKVWGVFTPERIYDPCCFCGEQCQRGRRSSCAFAMIIGRF